MKIRPSLSDFLSMSTRGALIAVYGEIASFKETPASVYQKLQKESFSFLMESIDPFAPSGNGASKTIRYSFIGCRPILVVSQKGRALEVKQDDGTVRRIEDGSPMDSLRRLCREFKPVAPRHVLPFDAGLFGYIHYDLIRTWERLPAMSPGVGKDPECVFIMPGRMVIFDHLSSIVRIVSFVHLKGGGNPGDAYEEARVDIRETKELVAGHPSKIEETGFPTLSGLRSNFGRRDFCAAVRKAKHYIRTGEVIQVVISQRFTGKLCGDSFAVYQRLSALNPSPYMYYIRFGETALIGCSPERLISLKNQRIRVCPIAGTRPSSDQPAKNFALARDLLRDEKERAEHIMLVDLARNDVGRVSMPGSVIVPRFMKVERFSHVMHLVSEVEGLLKHGCDGFDAFKSVFPAGTVTGAPKIRAMEIISELEPVPRGAYGGAVGWIDFQGNMEFCITIRTICLHGDNVSIQAGAGIVADSSPDREYEETLHKVGALFRALGEEVLP